MAEMALGEYYPKILYWGYSGRPKGFGIPTASVGKKIDAISSPQISITKLARKNPLGFKIKTAILPEIKLPEYKNIAKEIISNIPMRNNSK